MWFFCIQNNRYNIYQFYCIISKLLKNKKIIIKIKKYYKKEKILKKLNIFLLFGIKYFNLDKIFYNYKRKRKGNMQAIKQTKSTIPEIKDDFKTIIGELKPNLHASYNVSDKAQINITNDNINIYDPQEQSHFNINMGTDNHWIIVKDTNIGKGKKQKKIKSVLIYEKIYICPFSKY